MTVDMDRELKTRQAQDMPQELASELTAMRRLPANFFVGGRSVCKGCSGPKRKKGAHRLFATTGQEVGAWCATHGWLHFDSVNFPPTERLTPSELADRRLAASRRAKVARRKENTNA